MARANNGNIPEDSLSHVSTTLLTGDAGDPGLMSVAVKVRYLDAKGRPMPDTTVHWREKSGKTAPKSACTTTDARGYTTNIIAVSAQGSGADASLPTIEVSAGSAARTIVLPDGASPESSPQDANEPAEANVVCTYAMPDFSQPWGKGPFRSDVPLDMTVQVINHKPGVTPMSITKVAWRAVGGSGRFLYETSGARGTLGSASSQYSADGVPQGDELCEIAIGAIVDGTAHPLPRVTLNFREDPDAQSTLELISPIGADTPNGEEATQIDVIYRYSGMATNFFGNPVWGPLPQKDLEWRASIGTFAQTITTTDEHGEARNLLLLPPSTPTDKLARSAIMVRARKKLIDRADRLFPNSIGFPSRIRLLSLFATKDPNFLEVPATRHPQPMHIMVVDADNGPVAGIPVDWQVTGGTAASAQTTSGPDGRSSNLITVPCDGCTISITATFPDGGRSRANRHLKPRRATAKQLYFINPIPTDCPLVTANNGVHFAAVLLDESGEPVSHTDISWIVTAGGAHFDHPFSSTDSAGNAVNRLVFDTWLGDNQPAVVEVSIAMREDTSVKYAWRFGMINVLATDRNDLQIKSPPSNTHQPANTDVLLEAVYRDAHGVPLAGKEIHWSHDSDSVSPITLFGKSITTTEEDGSTINTVNCKLAAGKSAAVKIIATPREDASICGTATYEFDAPHSPPGEIGSWSPDPKIVETASAPLVVSAIYRNAGAGKVIEWCIVNGPASVSPAQSSTDSSGKASTTLTVTSDSSTQVALRAKARDSDVHADVVYTFAPATKPTLKITDPGTGDNLPLDTRVRFTATLAPAAKQTTTTQTLVWSGQGFDSKETTTDSNGNSSNYMVVETGSGYPDKPIERNVTVSLKSDPTVETNDTYQFHQAATTNKLAFTAPENADDLPFDQWIDMSVVLKNAMGHTLDNYNVTWSSSNGATLSSPTSTTVNGGIATNKVKFSEPGSQGQQVTVRADAKDAKAQAAIMLRFRDTPKPGDGFYLIYDHIYVPHFPNEPAPSNPNQVITATAYWLRDGQRVPNLRIQWVVDPHPGYERAYHADGTAIDILEGGRFDTTTGAGGVSIVKFGSTAPYMGRIHAQPEGDASYQRTILMDSINIAGGSYQPPHVPFDSIFTIPTDKTFDASVPATAVPAAAGTEEKIPVAMWLQGKDNSPVVQMTNLRDAKAGVEFGYSSLRVGSAEQNYMGYFATDLASNARQSQVIALTAHGATQSTHPDHSLPRSLAKPYLEGHATQVNEYNSAHGLRLYVPPYDNRKDNDVVTVTVYLNGFDANYLAKASVFTLDSQTVSAAGNDPLLFTIDAGHLTGYGADSSGRPGTFEAEYIVQRATQAIRSHILDGVALDTVPYYVAKSIWLHPQATRPDRN